MRVLVFTNMYPSEDAPGYAPYMAEQVSSLRAAGVDVDLLVFNPRRTRLSYGLVVPELVCRLRSGRYDVVHTHHTYSFLVADFARIVARSRVPIVLTNHEGEASDAAGRVWTWRATSLLRNSLWLKRLVAHRADVAIYVSHRLSKAISRRGQQIVIPCGVDLCKFVQMSRAACREKLGIPRDALVIFFPPNPEHKEKRFALASAVYDVVRQQRSTTLLATGGSIPHVEMPTYYNAADVVLQTSYHEGSPTVIKEALACEVPVVSTDVGDTRELICGVEHCFVCTDDPQVLAQHVLRCAGQRATGGRKRVIEAGVGVDQVAQRLIHVYAQAVKKSSSGSHQTPKRQIVP